MKIALSRGAGTPETVRNKQETVYELIRQRIESGTYVPGQRLIVDQLSGEFGVSQVPIREAIRRLEAESLVTYTANTGAAVAPFSPEIWSDLYESVAVLEGYATALAAPLVTAADLEQLRGCNQEIRDSLRALDLTAISRANRRFHAIILARCPNRILIDQFSQLKTRLDSLSRVMFARDQGVLLQLLGPKAGAAAIEDHREIIAALRAKEKPATIERLTREHVLVHLSDVRALLEGRELGGQTQAIL